MDGPKPKRKCEMRVDSTPKSVNDTGYREEPAKYMANPKKGFNDALSKALNKWEERNK